MESEDKGNVLILAIAILSVVSFTLESKVPYASDNFRLCFQLHPHCEPALTGSCLTIPYLKTMMNKSLSKQIFKSRCSLDGKQQKLDINFLYSSCHDF